MNEDITTIKRRNCSLNVKLHDSIIENEFKGLVGLNIILMNLLSVTRTILNSYRILTVK
ncbi:hypothetical protein J2Z52_002681 [Enterococcus rivorum]|nr:hypothetical protein [Enterococcus rivorum]